MALYHISIHTNAETFLKGLNPNFGDIIQYHEGLSPEDVKKAVEKHHPSITAKYISDAEERERLKSEYKSLRDSTFLMRVVEKKEDEKRIELKALKARLQDRNNPDHKHSMMLTYSDCSATITIEEDGSQIGSVKTSVGGSKMITIKPDDDTHVVLFVSVTDIWNSAVESIDRPDLKIEQ